MVTEKEINRGIVKIIAIGGVVVPLVVDLVINFIGMGLIAQGDAMVVAFRVMGIMNVLFVFLALMAKQRVMWMVFCIIVVFFDVSVCLEETRAQSEASITTDSEITRLDDLIASYRSRIEDQEKQYDSAMRRETLAEIDARIKRMDDALEEALKGRSARLSLIEGGELSTYRISSKDVFLAITKAIEEGRVIQLVVFLTMFIGLQIMIYISIKTQQSQPVETVKRKQQIRKKPVNQESTYPLDKRKKPIPPTEAAIKLGISFSEAYDWHKRLTGHDT